jgi:hypothetical protein
MKNRQRLLSASGQSILEFTIVMPLILLVVLGVVEVGYALLDQQVVTRLTREGSNLISRSTTIEDATTAMTTMHSRPVNFNDGSSRLIFSVIKRGGTVGTANFDQLFLYQRRVFGSYPGTSKLIHGGGSFNGAPDYEAVNSDNDPNLRVTNVDPNLVMNRGGMIYITEIYTRHNLITPFDRFGVPIPETLYSIAYF